MTALTETVTLRLPLLKRGSPDTLRIKRLQHMLNTSILNFAEEGSEPELIPETGGFGDRTERAVKLFQNLQDLEEDGQVGKETWTALLTYWLAFESPPFG